MLDSQHSSRPVSILVADDHPYLLAGIKAIIDAAPDLWIVGEAHDGPSALGSALELRPDVVVLDVSMPGINGFEVGESLHAAWPDCRILFLTMHQELAYVRKSLQCGGTGFLSKRCAAEELTQAIRTVHIGETYVGRDIRMPVTGCPDDRTGPGNEAEPVALSQRETEVLQAVALGHTMKQIAMRYNISVHTVETYRARAMEKLGLRSRVELIRHAVAAGWMATTRH